MRAHSGLTLIELLVTLVILSILAAGALPYAELTITRTKELELRRTLREVRGAIDRIHRDWLDGQVSPTEAGLSADGYPRTLTVLVEGVGSGQADGRRRYYLRRIPKDPFADPGLNPELHWMLRSYQDAPDNQVWGGQDVYDVRSQSGKTAIDGTSYRDW